MHTKRIQTGGAVALCTLSILIIGGCVKPKEIPSAPGQGEVWYRIGEFTPHEIIIPSGETVTWRNKDQHLHTVTSDTGLFGATMAPNTSFSFTFTQIGTYNYFDEYDASHREVGGIVSVR